MSNEIISLSFPVNAAYVSSARLTASSIANRIRFDIDEIEDIKTAVSEACTYIIKVLPSSVKSNFLIKFTPGVDQMGVEIIAKGGEVLTEVQADDLSITMIRAIMDEFSLEKKDHITITMLKKHKKTLFE